MSSFPSSSGMGKLNKQTQQSQHAVTPDTTTQPHNTFTSWQHMTRTVAHYERQDQIGEGTYGQVYKAVCKDTGQPVALKKMRLHHSGYWGMPLQMVREIKILRRLQHPNLLQLIEVVTSKGVEHLDPEDPPTITSNKKEDENVKNNEDKTTADAREAYKGNLFLVLEYVTHDLTGLMDVGYPFTPVQIKCIFRQLLQALEYMHQNKYVHRDIKSSNILLNSRFELKLADFGLARSLEPPLLDQMEQQKTQSSYYNNGNMDLTNKVITLWYRPPEILLGTVHYGCAVDVWSAGCILAELCLGKPLFTGKAEVDQLRLIADLLGTPSPDTFKYLQSLKKRSVTGSSSSGASAYIKASNEMEMTCTNLRPSKLRDKYSSGSNGKSGSSSNSMPDSAITLLEKLLEWDPRKRLTAKHALEHRYFWTQPVAPTNPADLGSLQVAESGHFHEFQTKQKRRQAKAVAEEAKKEAIFKGASQEEAQTKYDSVYRRLMKQVAQEGLSATDKINSKGEKDEFPKGGSASRRSRSNSSGRRGERSGRRNSGERSSKDDRDREKSRKRREHRKRRDEERAAAKRRERERRERDKKVASPVSEKEDEEVESDRSPSRRHREEDDDERRRRKRREKDIERENDERRKDKRRRKDRSSEERSEKEKDVSSGEEENIDEGDRDRKSKRRRRSNSSKRHRKEKDRDYRRDRERRDRRDRDRSYDRDMPPPYYDDWDRHYPPRRRDDILPPYGPPPPGYPPYGPPPPGYRDGPMPPPRWDRDGPPPPRDRDGIPPPRERDIPPRDRDLPPRDREIPPRDRDGPPRDRDIPPRDRDFGPPSHYGPPSRAAPGDHYGPPPPRREDERGRDRDRRGDPGGPRREGPSPGDHYGPSTDHYGRVRDDRREGSRRDDRRSDGRKSMPDDRGPLGDPPRRDDDRDRPRDRDRRKEGPPRRPRP